MQGWKSQRENKQRERERGIIRKVITNEREVYQDR